MWNASQSQPLDRFQRVVYQKLQVSVLMCTLKPKFINIAPDYERDEMLLHCFKYFVFRFILTVKLYCSVKHIATLT